MPSESPNYQQQFYRIKENHSSPLRIMSSVALIVSDTPDFSPSVYWGYIRFAVPCPFHKMRAIGLYVPICHNPVLIRTIHSIATIMMKKPHTTSKRRPQFLLFLYRNLIDSLRFGLYLMRQNINGMTRRKTVPAICITAGILNLFITDDKGRKKVQYQHMAISMFPSPGLFSCR